MNKSHVLLLSMLTLSIAIIVYPLNIQAQPQRFSDQKLRIAVLDFKAEGIPTAIATTISNMVRTDLVNSRKFLVVERGQVATILEEQGLQQTGCTDSECAVQMGKLLSAHRMLLGDVTRLDDNYYVTIRVVDVEKGVVEHAEKGSIAKDSSLDAGVSSITQKLIDRMIGEAQPLQPDTIIPARTPDKTTPQSPSLTTMIPLPKGITIGYNYFAPSNADVDQHYSNFQGLGVGYVYPFDHLFSASVNVSYTMAKDSAADTSSSFNTYQASIRAGTSLHRYLYPYAGVFAQGMWVRESGSSASANYTGFGGGLSIGMASMFYQRYGLYLEYNYSLAILMDDNSTNVGGSTLAAGLIYRYR